MGQTQVIAGILGTYLLDFRTCMIPFLEDLGHNLLWTGSIPLYYVTLLELISVLGVQLGFWHWELVKSGRGIPWMLLPHFELSKPIKLAGLPCICSWRLLSPWNTLRKVPLCCSDFICFTYNIKLFQGIFTMTDPTKWKSILTFSLSLILKKLFLNLSLIFKFLFCIPLGLVSDHVTD